LVFSNNNLDGFDRQWMDKIGN